MNKLRRKGYSAFPEIRNVTTFLDKDDFLKLWEKTRIELNTKLYNNIPILWNTIEEITPEEYFKKAWYDNPIYYKSEEEVKKIITEVVNKRNTNSPIRFYSKEAWEQFDKAIKELIKSEQQINK